ncbi:hypothetical protein ACFO1V_09750 [Daeguia caeni]|uniref:Uncharacterized protein n=1 Tax=Daeguia caeni TaxID=439612 RepID=A0ABV9H520_9HYPH
MSPLVVVLFTIPLLLGVPSVEAAVSDGEAKAGHSGDSINSKKLKFGFGKSKKRALQAGKSLDDSLYEQPSRSSTLSATEANSVSRKSSHHYSEIEDPDEDGAKKKKKAKNHIGNMYKRGVKALRNAKKKLEGKSSKATDEKSSSSREGLGGVVANGNNANPGVSILVNGLKYIDDDSDGYDSIDEAYKNTVGRSYNGDSTSYIYAVDGSINNSSYNISNSNNENKTGLYSIENIRLNGIQIYRPDMAKNSFDATDSDESSYTNTDTYITSDSENSAYGSHGSRSFTDYPWDDAAHAHSRHYDMVASDDEHVLDRDYKWNAISAHKRSKQAILWLSDDVQQNDGTQPAEGYVLVSDDDDLPLDRAMPLRRSKRNVSGQIIRNDDHLNLDDLAEELRSAQAHIAEQTTPVLRWQGAGTILVQNEAEQQPSTSGDARTGNTAEPGPGEVRFFLENDQNADDHAIIRDEVSFIQDRVASAHADNGADHAAGSRASIADRKRKHSWIHVVPAKIAKDNAALYPGHSAVIRDDVQLIQDNLAAASAEPASGTGQNEQHVSGNPVRENRAGNSERGLFNGYILDINNNNLDINNNIDVSGNIAGPLSSDSEEEYRDLANTVRRYSVDSNVSIMPVDEDEMSAGMARGRRTDSLNNLFETEQPSNMMHDDPALSQPVRARPKIKLSDFSSL